MRTQPAGLKCPTRLVLAYEMLELEDNRLIVPFCLSTFLLVVQTFCYQLCTNWKTYREENVFSKILTDVFNKSVGDATKNRPSVKKYCSEVQTSPYAAYFTYDFP